MHTVSKVNRHIELAGLFSRRKGNRPEHLLVEFAKDDHGSAEEVSLAILFKADVRTQMTKPDFPLMKENARLSLVDL